MKPSHEQENQDIRAEIAELRVRDSLTGLFNRKHFYRLASAEISKQRRNSVLAMLYIRPDRFSEIDERFGPLASDALLRGLGHLILEQVGKHSIVARFGGNIFTVLVVRRSFREVRDLSDHLLTSVSKSIFSAEDQSACMTVSVGVVELSDVVSDVVQAFSLAQSAARKARDKGGNQVYVNRSMEFDAQGELQDAGWARKIRSALEEDELHLVYQPIASLVGANQRRYDVLVRMEDDKQNEILPGDFMPAAERTGLMPAMDRWIIETAFHRAAEQIRLKKPAQFFLRVSESSLRNAKFEPWVQQLYKQYELTEDTIVFQVDEPVAERNISRVRSLESLCKTLRCELAIAHFGVGENCMQLLPLIPMDYLIIDGDFMENLVDPARRLQLEMIVNAAKEKKIPIIATRVENALELTELCHMGIDHVIGYHVQEPEEILVEQVRLLG